MFSIATTNYSTTSIITACCAETLLASAAFAARLLAALSIHGPIIAHRTAQLGGAEGNNDFPAGKDQIPNKPVSRRVPDGNRKQAGPPGEDIWYDTLAGQVSQMFDRP